MVYLGLLELVLWVSVFLVDFSDKAIVQKEDETQSSMKRVFEQNIKYYTVEDKNFLNRIFL